MPSDNGNDLHWYKVLDCDAQLVLQGHIAVRYSPPSTPRAQRLFWKLMDEAPDAHRELLDVEVDE